jgi:HAD superfamily hydrolase (TIGR01549 family)
MHAWWSDVDFLRGVEEVAYDVPRALHEAGLRIGIVSGFAWDLRVHLKHQGLAHLVDTCVISYEVGREKPDPELFRAACEELGADPRPTAA